MADTHKRLGQALAEIASLARQPHDEQSAQLLRDRIDEFAAVGGKAAAQLFADWLRQGSPHRDPRPSVMRPVEAVWPSRERPRGRL